MQVRLLGDTDKPSLGYVRRPHPLWPEFAFQMTWFSVIECQANGRDGMIYVWVPKSENWEYERGHERKRFCRTYRGTPRNILIV